VTAKTPRWASVCAGCGQDAELESRSTHGERALCDGCAAQPYRMPSADAVDAPRPTPGPRKRGRLVAVDSATSYAVTFSDTKPPKLLLPPVPNVDDAAGHCAWLTAAFNLNPAQPITSGQHEGLRGAAGHVVLKRRGAPPLRFEPASRINTPARLIEDLSWQAGPTDGAVHALKAEHCRQIAHVVRMLCGATKAITDEEETAGLVLAFLAGAVAREGLTIYGTPEQRYEAATALQRDVDEHTGRPCGAARYLIDANTGEYVMRVPDLGESVRRQLGSGLARGFLDGRMAGLGWTRARLDGHAKPGRAGRSGPHARCQVYRGLIGASDDEGSVSA
jgi:hypothetical protein